MNGIHHDSAYLYVVGLSEPETKFYYTIKIYTSDGLAFYSMLNVGFRVHISPDPN